MEGRNGSEFLNTTELFEQVHKLMNVFMEDKSLQSRNDQERFNA